MFKRLRARYGRIKRNMTRQVAWDLFMVYLALINMGLIIFDLTYLWLRPTYFEFLPVVTRIYDPVKGIEPHPLTQTLLEKFAKLRKQLDSGTRPIRIEPTLIELRELSREVLETDPFERSGQTKSMRQIWVGMRDFLEAEPGDFAFGALDQPIEISDLFWSFEPEPDRLKARSSYFSTRLAPLLAVNYYRRFDLEGELTDYFPVIDLPFLLIFAAEFFTRWWLSYRRGSYARWWFFPIFNWYDLLGIIPLKQFRVFRLFRIASIYVRLHRSEHSIVGDDIVSRTVGYIANIISEEISDMVTLRILNETQEELSDGTHKRIIRSVAEEHRDALAVQLTSQISDLMMSAEVRDQARGFLDANLERAVESAEALQRIPVPDAVLRPLVTSIGGAVFDAFADTLAATVESPEGKETIRFMISNAVDGLVEEITEGEMEALVREISVQVIDQMKETVSVRKWTLADQPRRGILTREIIE
jgi:hypothetical protein